MGCFKAGLQLHRVDIRAVRQQLDRWLRRHGATFILRKVGWHTAAHYRCEAELAVACRFGFKYWGRRRIGRPHGRWETSMPLVWEKRGAT